MKLFSLKIKNEKKKKKKYNTKIFFFFVQYNGFIICQLYTLSS